MELQPDVNLLMVTIHTEYLIRIVEHKRSSFETFRTDATDKAARMIRLVFGAKHLQLKNSLPT